MLLVRHRAERHRLFACNLCDYNFNQTDIEAHHAKTHRMLPATVPAFAPESYFDTKIEVITTTGEKMKLKVKVILVITRCVTICNFSVSCVTSPC